MQNGRIVLVMQTNALIYFAILILSITDQRGTLFPNKAFPIELFRQSLVQEYPNCALSKIRFFPNWQVCASGLFLFVLIMTESLI